ncbi:DNA repair protein XRCC4 isoform X2 [Lolium perenne]|uniref:DNA repair protein XRCC4 isoform X2 n=1 Tax=Lolium perenne TaxID=4522 RepID=UPI0021F617BB|nr:DNA repair protein XRCC4-like isoform X2 [Lolium perenne]
MATPAAAPRHSCAKLSVAVEDPKAPGGGGIFVKATWLPTRFSLAVTDGAGAWVADASDAEVRLRAEQWDQPVPEYLALAERYLAFHQPASTYSFHEAGNGNRREEVVRKTQSFDKLKQEAEKCLQQSERFNNEKADFEQASFTKFVAVLNSKKVKLRLLKDKIAAHEAADKAPKEDEDNESSDKGPGEEDEGNSTDRTEPFEEDSDKDPTVKDEPSETWSGNLHSSPEKSAATSTSRGRRGRKRTRK